MGRVAVNKIVPAPYASVQRSLVVDFASSLVERFENSNLELFLGVVRKVATESSVYVPDTEMGLPFVKYGT